MERVVVDSELARPPIVGVSVELTELDDQLPRLPPIGIVELDLALAPPAVLFSPVVVPPRCVRLDDDVSPPRLTEWADEVFPPEPRLGDSSCGALSAGLLPEHASADAARKAIVE